MKGVAFRSVLASLAELRGDESVERALGQLTADERSEIEFRIVQTGWYPIELYRRLFDVIVETTGEGASIVRAIGAAAIRRDITGVYRVMFSVLSPETVIALAGKLFNSYYDTGTVAIVERRSGYARSSYARCFGFDANMWTEVLGSSEALLAIAGAKHVRAQLVRGGDDAACECVMEARWA
ncbi:MAG: hypothetical protein JNK05_02085 [Myxococcales bacterium]|nr:hypothetical protein [Myxococcales bacterium]